MGGCLFELLLYSRLSLAFLETRRASIGTCSLLGGVALFEFLVKEGRGGGYVGC